MELTKNMNISFLSWLLLVLHINHFDILSSSSISSNFAAAVEAPDIVAIAPDRSTAYPNGLHNGLLLSANRLNVTLEIRDVGNFDPELSRQVLQAAIDNPIQPKIYCIWPVDFPSRGLVQLLYITHGVPIIQMNQLPGEDTQWEWNHLVGYAGPDDALRASNAGKMMIQAMKDHEIDTPQVVLLGYPETYGGYHLSVAAFEGALAGSNVNIYRKLPLDWGTQPAYLAVLNLLDEFEASGETLHGIYAMDDSILQGAYQAIADKGTLVAGKDITLVGTVCNGARELLETGSQYGTTVQGPFLEGELAIRSAKEYIDTGTLSSEDGGHIRFTPNPIVTGDTWSSEFVEFGGQSYTVDDLCTWSLFYERVAGPTSVDDAKDICELVDCSYIPVTLFIVGYILLGINYVLALGEGIALYYYRDKKLIQVAQPFFLGLVILGSIVDTTSVLFMSRDNRSYSASQLGTACVVWPWLLSLGHMMTTATLVAKIYRVKRIVDSAGAGVRKSLNRVKVSIQEVSFFIVVFLLLDLIILIIWFASDPFQWEFQISNVDYQGYITSARGECRSDGENAWLYPFSIGLLHLGVLIYANVLAYQTYDYQKISDSKNVAVALFNSIQLLLVATPLLAVVGDNVATSYLIRVCFVFLNNFGVLVLVVLPKLYACIQGEGDIIPQLDMNKIGSVATPSRISHMPEQSMGGAGRAGNHSGSNSHAKNSGSGSGSGGKYNSRANTMGSTGNNNSSRSEGNRGMAVDSSAYGDDDGVLPDIAESSEFRYNSQGSEWSRE